MEVVVTGGASFSGLLSRESDDAAGDPGFVVGAEPVCICVGGRWTYGIKERTLCSVAAGERPAH
jgi:hypothetical protein